VLDDVRGGRDVLEIELGDPIDVLEDPRELPGHALDLLVGEPQPRQARDVEHLLSLDHAAILGRSDRARAGAEADHRPLRQVIFEHIGVDALALQTRIAEFGEGVGDSERILRSIGAR
jgi:hypothetical protein